MATLIPALGSCVARMTSGERRLAERLQDKLDADYLLWYDVPVGPTSAHPDFCILHPSRGILILEVKDWKLSTIQQADKTEWIIAPDGVLKTVTSPLEQSRQYAHQVVSALQRDPQLVQSTGPHQGKLAFPWSYGVVLPNITRKQFQDAELHHALEPHRVLCKDEMLESIDPEDLQSRLWDMFPYGMRGQLSQPQIDRVRWNLFPQVRVPTQDTLFDDSDEAATVPDILRVMDIQQEQLARSLGDGHRVIHGVDRKQIPSGQYQAVMIDEGHDFAPEWLKLVVQMVDPATNSLLVLYDDAQSIYERARTKQFSFKSVGIQAQGRTTILKINYRNTRQILHTASLVAADLLTADDKDDDGIPLLKPVSCGREGQEPLIITLPTLQAEADAIADHLAQAHQEGFAWGDMAVLCADTKTRDLCARTLAQRKLPVENRLGSGDFAPTSNKIKVMTMKVSKGLEFPVVALPGVGHMPANGEDEKEAARVFYVAATRATQRLVMGVGGKGNFAQRLHL